MSIWQTVTWDVARAGGFTAYILLTLAVAIGLALTLHWQTPRWPRLINSELHNFVTLLALIFTGVHVLAVWLDPFTNFGWNEVFLPFVSHYRPLWMAFGIVALYLGLAIGLSTWVRPYIGYTWWRRLHMFTLLTFALVAVHGITTGSDTRSWWGACIYAGSMLLVGILLWLRLYEPANAQSKAHPVLAMGMVAVIVAGAIAALLGPFQIGWNTVANNGHGSGGSSVVQGSTGTQGARAAKQPVQPAQTVFTPTFSGNVQGLMTQHGPDNSGNVTLRLNMTIKNGPQGMVQVVLGGQVVDNAGNISVTSSHVTLSSADGTQVYTGSLTNLTARGQWDMTALLHASGTGQQPLQVHMLVQVDNAGQSTGTISGNANAGGASGGSVNQ